MVRAVEAAGWSLAAFALWLTTLSSVTVPEVLCAAAVAVPCGIFAPLMRTTLEDGWRGRGRWSVLAVLVPWRAAAELVPVIRATMLRRHGRLRRVELPAGSRPTRGCRAALMILGSNATPGRLVLHVDNGLRCFIVHDLVAAGRQLEEVLTGGRTAGR
jgi:hypothetical protein